MKNTTLNNTIFFVVTIIVLLVSLILISIFSGFQHEMKKFKTMVVTIVLIVLFQLIICDPIKFVLLSIDAATWPKKTNLIRQMKKNSAEQKFDLIDYLKLKLKQLQSQLIITKEHRNERLNEKYHIITTEIWLYGSYFLVLLVYVMVHQRVILYYNTSHVVKLLYNNQADTLGAKEITFINQIYTYIQKTLIDPFEPNVEKYHHDGWTQIEQMKMLGVVRLRQVRAVDNHIGLSVPKWEKNTYLPEWRLPYKRLHYTAKYWRTFEPWQPLTHEPTLLNALLLNFYHYGSFQFYPELNGYIALLTAYKVDSLKVMQFLKSYNWINQNTSAIFMDFTLYNVDSNLFSVCTVTVENPPFGVQIPKVNVESAFLIENLDKYTHLELIILILYVLLLFKFAQNLVVKIWYDRNEIRSSWNQLDMVICLLNIILLIISVIREEEVVKLLNIVELASKSEFLDFRRPTKLYQMTNILIGFLICLTTFRLWKVFQFASVFQIVTRTLYVAWPAVASTGIIIIIFIVAVGIAMKIVNGDNSQHFSDVLKSTVSCMCFAMGFISHMSTRDMFFDGNILGIVFYLIFVFIVTIVLINVFASIIFAYFGEVENMESAAGKRHINFIQYLRMEYATFFKCRWARKQYHRNGNTVTENIQKTLDERERFEAQSLQITVKKKPKEFDLNLDYRKRLEKSYCLVAIMLIQIQLIERLVFGDKNGNLEPLSDSDYTSDSDIPEMYRRNK